MNRQQNEKNTIRRFWDWTNDGGERVLRINGTIAQASWLDDDITPSMFRDELNAASGPITIWLCSPGGDCIAASQIYAMLTDYPHDVTVKIDGIAASAASVIAMAGTTVLMVPTALMMVHNPATMAFGDHTDMEKAIDMLASVKESIINAYEIKTGLPRKQLAQMMEEETWMDVEKAVELGFADGILQREGQPTAMNNAPFLFSQRAVDAALVNKLVGGQRVNPVSDVPIQPLYERLEQMKERP